MLLTLGAGTAWGDEVTETITMKGFAGITVGSYQNFTKTGSSDKGTAMVAYAYNGQTGQVRGNKTSVAGASVTTEDKTKNWSLYNSQAMGGAIKAIKVTQTATGTNLFQNNLFVSLGTSSQGEVTDVTNAQIQDAGGTAQEINFSIDPSKGYTYFKLLSNQQFAKGTIANVVVTVTYETAGGGETPDPEPDPTQYTIKWHTAKGVTTDVTLNEGATITKPATDPTMTGYVFMGWTASCDVASDGSDFTALTDFGIADSDKDFYAVFAKATTTGGGAATETTASVVIEDYASAKNWVNGTKYTTVEIDANITATATVTSGSNTGKYYNTSGYEWRLYQTESAKLTISANNSLNIKTVKITYNKSNSGVLKLNNSNVSTGTVQDVNASSITFSVGNTGSATNGQVKVTAMEVVYTSGGGGTTTYDNYITTCASGIEYVELGDDFKWSATEAEVTIDATDNVFPTLTNTHTVPVTYSSSDATIASIAADGTVTLNKEGTVTITAKYTGGTSAGTGKEYKAKTVTYSLKVNKAAPVASGTTYVKVTSTAGITDGEYLIVYEAGNVAFDGSLAPVKLDVVSNNIEVSIASNTIAGNTDIDAATFTINTTAGTIQTKDGYYIGQTSNANGLATSTTTEYTNTISVEDDGSATIISSGGAYLRYNSDVNNWRFRYYKSSSYSGQKAIALYKKASKHTVTIADCTNGSVSAKMGETALATNDQVLSGIQITLNNTPATNYKLAAYDVYKTGEESTKVTVTDGKFIMPEFDVTISATFEAAKTLNSIEITTPATQTTFWQNETFNHDGLKVTAHFDGAEDEDVTDKVTVTGSTATAGAAVVVTVSFTEGTTTQTATYTITVKAIPNTKETAYSVADAYDIIDKLGTASGVFISGIISQVDSYNSTYKSITYWISADGTTTKQLQVYSGKGLESADFTAVTDVAKGAQVIVCGNLKKHNTTYEFDYNNYLAAYTAPTKAEPGIAYEKTEYTANVNEAFTAPTLTNPNGLTVTYSTSDATLATVNATTGEVTILNKTGKVTITATFAGNETYLHGTASYNITISDPSLLEATFDATQDLDANNTTKGEGKITKSPITFACTDGILGNGSAYRLYQNAKISFTAENGYAITKLVITSTASGTSQYGPGLLSNENGTYSVSDKTGTWVGEAQTVTFTATAQSRAKLITVYYKTDNRQDAGLVWSTENVSITIGDAFTVPTLSNPNGLTLTCTSDNENLATVTNAGVVTLKSGVTGKATITAKFDGNSNYKDATVTCTITVNPKTETVVILAQYNGQWYALKNVEETEDKVLAALPVNYVGGKLYNVEEADKATIEWQRAAVTDGIIFKNGENYIYGTAGGTDLKLSTTECAWTLDGSTYKIGNRTFIYRAQANGFKNYNATTTPGTDDYSNLPVVTAPVYATGDAYSRSTTAGKLGTICLPFGSTNYTGATFYEFVGSETGKVYLGSVITLEAGVPYIFEASAAEVAVYGDGTTAVSPGSKNGLVGTFTNDTEVAVGNYILKENKLCQAADICYVNANRAYVVMNDVPSGAPQQMPGRRYIGMSVQGENETTGVEDIFSTDAPVKVIENGQLIIIRDGVKYNVQGQKL